MKHTVALGIEANLKKALDKAWLFLNKWVEGT